MGTHRNHSTREGPAAHSPERFLLLCPGRQESALLDQLIRAGIPGDAVLVHTPSLPTALTELIDHGATCVLARLSEEDGPETVEALHAAAPQAAIIALLGSENRELAIRAVRAGAQDCLLTAQLAPSSFEQSVTFALERKRSERALAELGLHDPLTGLPNRALFLDRLGVALDRAARTGGALATLFMDVDNFKEINDTYGHAAGDEVLAALARRLRAMLRPMDTLARFGGDEFTLLFEDLASEREVVLIAERIARASRRPIRFTNGEATISVSIGIATVVDPDTPPETVLREADTAMYRAKEAGRGRYELFDEVSRMRALERLELESALDHAVERSELRVFYQPRVSLGGELGVAGFEALVRWEHPERGLISPAEFLPLAEETGTVLRIGEFVLRHALEHLAHWRTIRPELTVSVNLSPRQLEDAGLVSMLGSLLRATGVAPEALWLEIPESSLSSTDPAVARTLDGLKAVGVKLAVDDYGLGSASLAELRRLPLDSLKIHESFLATLDDENDAGDTGHLVRAIVQLGHALGLGVAAEGIETDYQLERVRALGCDGAQGYFLGRPVPEEAVGSLLAPAGI
jgi:diguanylate cyclase (GGDEF)-like protein